MTSMIIEAVSIRSREEARRAFAPGRGARGAPTFNAFHPLGRIGPLGDIAEAILLFRFGSKFLDHGNSVGSRWWRMAGRK